MKNFVALMSGIVLGGGMGFAAGYFVSKNKYEKLADKEVNSVKEALTNRCNELSKQLEEVSSKLVVNDKKSVADSKVEQKKTVTKKQTKKEVAPIVNEDDVAYNNYTDYTKYYEKSPILSKEEKEKFSSEIKKASKNSKLPYIIDDLESVSRDAEVVTLYLYSNGTLLDDDEREYDLKETLGEEIVSHLDTLNETGGQFYVAHDDINIVYEVLCEASDVDPKK